MIPLQQRAAAEGELAVSILEDIHNYRREQPYALAPTVGNGGWFDCECGNCISDGHDFHAWEAFEDHAQEAIHLAVLLLSERDFERAVMTATSP